MKWIFVLIALLFTGLVACTTEEANDGITGALHRIEYGNNVVYLFGTMHAGHPDWFPLADVVEDALRGADVVFTEIGVDNAAIQSAFNNTLFLPGNMTWRQYLPEDKYNHLVETLETWGVLRPSRVMNPTIIIRELELSMSFELSELDGDFANSVDMYVANVALELGIPVYALENLERSSDIANNLPFEVMLAMIAGFLPKEQFIEALADVDTHTLDDFGFYYANNDFDSINNLYALELDSEDLYAVYVRDEIANRRSIYMAQDMSRLLKETEAPTTFFVAVGLSHVIRSRIGDEHTDIIQQLELKDFIIIPLY